MANRAKDEKASSDPKGAASLLQVLETFASIIKTVTLPLVLLFLFFEFRSPLSDIARLLPQKIDQAYKVSAGGLSIEIERSAKASGNPELAKLIDGLSRNALEILLRSSKNESSIMSTSPGASPGQVVYNIPHTAEIAALQELETNGLIEPGKPISEWYEEVKQKLALKNNYGTYDAYVALKGKAKLDEESEKSLWAARYKLSELGEKSVDLIIRSVTEELQKPTHSNSKEWQSGKR